MKRIIATLIIVFSITIVKAQEKDTISFIKSKRMSDADLAKKREGTFITGIPDFSSDPVTGFGLGVRTNIYWNGQRTNPFFAYTPYLAKLKANAAYYTSNAREIILSLDVPYYKGTRWRFKVDFKAQQNPANLYFGSTESTLGELRLPSTLNGGQTYSTYSSFDKARKTLRPGGIGEASFVTDALSNRFRETEYMLNLKADYALGKKGVWRIMGGYEIQHLSYKTFEGTEAEAIDPVTGQETTAPNGTSLLRRDFQQGLVSGLNGGWVSIIQTALIFDTRDFEPDPTRGYYVEIANEFSSPIIGSQFDFNKLFIQGRVYKKIPIGTRTVFGGRFGVAPFFDAGTVRDKWQDLNFTNIKTSYGGGLRIAWNQSTIISFDYGVSKEDKLFYFGIGQAF
jgi:outer membrane protein assembly factor BamA